MTEQSFLDGYMTLHPHAGTLSITFPGREAAAPEAWTPIQNGTASVDYRLGGTSRRLVLSGPDVSFGIGENLVTFSHQDDHLHLDWGWTRVNDALEGWLEVTNRGDSHLTVDRLNVLRLTEAGSVDLPGSVADWRIYLNGWQSWAPTGVRRVGSGPFPAPADDECRLKNLPHGAGLHENKLRSQWVTVIAATSEREEDSSESAQPDPVCLLLGFVTGADQLAEIILDAGDEFRGLNATCHADDVSLGPGESLRSERLRVATGHDGWTLLEAWAGWMGELMGARVPERTPTGWCTWHYYFGLNTAQDVYANLGAIRRQHLPLDLVIIDDGYQAAIGDWLTLNSERFTDMTAVSATIHREGRMPGIWIAPFGLADDSQTWAGHPDWVVRDEAGEPVLAWKHYGRPIYALDTTHPDAANWLRTTFRTMRREWGYDAFKVDSLFAAALPGHRHDTQATRAQALRRGLRLIRDAIGDDAFLLGCGAPLGPAVGLVDGMRIGPDVSTNWESPLQEDLSAPSTANAVRNCVARAYTHGRLWAADPGCLLARPRGDNSQLTLYEARTLATIIALTGGMTIDGDRVRDLPPSRLTMLRQTLPPTDRIAYPLDLFEGDLPEILTLPVERPWGRWWLAGIINWDDHTRSTDVELGALGLSPGRYHVYDQWRAMYLGQAEGSLTFPRQRPHETLLLLFKPVSDSPDWLTSTFHLMGGSVEVVDVIRQKLGERRLKLVVHVEQEGENFGRLVFTVPEGWVVLDAQVNGRRRSVNVRNQEAGLVDMGFTLRDRAWVLVDLARVQRNVARQS
jgi:alpha-galactosidase